MSRYSMFIGGKFTGGKSIDESPPMAQVVDPATEAVVSEVPAGTRSTYRPER